MSTPRDLQEQTQALPRPIRDLLAEIPRELAEFREISTLQSPDKKNRATYQLVFADGGKLKARTLPSQGTIDFLVKTVPLLPEDQFPRIVAHNKNAILEEWFEGELLSGVAVSEEQFVAAGRFLGNLHCTRFSGMSGYRSAIGYRSWFEALLFQVVYTESVDMKLARKAHDFAAPYRPQKTKYVLAHRDLCPDNLLIRGGKLCSIDNMLLSSRANSEDLARTWFRWKMTPTQWLKFLSGYREFLNPQRFLDESRFWIVFAVLSSVLSRTRNNGLQASVDHREFLERYLMDPEIVFRPYRPSAA